MEEYSNLKMTMENRKQAIEAVEIIKNLASKRTPESPNELIHYLADVKIKKNMVIVDNSCSLFSNTFLELTSDIMKSCASLTKNSFTANAWFTSCNCGYQACIDAERNGNNVELTTIVGEDGCCPECGVQVVNYDEYDPNETYYCPECGKEVDHLEMFDGTVLRLVIVFPSTTIAKRNAHSPLSSWKIPVSLFFAIKMPPKCCLKIVNLDQQEVKRFTRLENKLIDS